FVQPAPPTGWVLSAAFNDRLIRVNGDHGGDIGGSWLVTGLSTQGHVLTQSEMPSHDHIENVGQGGGVGYLAWSVTTGSSVLGSGIHTDLRGNDQPHSHGDVVSSGAWRPAYVD